MCDGCVDRRGFLSQGVLAAVTLALAACSKDATGVTLSGTQTIKVSDFGALANVNGVATMTLGGVPLAVVRTGTSTFLALSRVCPHQGSTVNQNGNGWLCPNHGAMFTLTGTWTGGERTSNMRSYPTAYNATTDVLTIG